MRHSYFLLLGDNYGQHIDEELTLHSKNEVKKLVERYNSADIDKIAKVNNVLKKTEGEM